MITSDFRKKMVDSWFSYLQIQICKEFELLEKNKFSFQKRDWNKSKKNQGGGTSFLLNNGKIFAIGGRVLNFVTLSDNFKSAKNIIYKNLNELNWTGGFYRKDIGFKVIE